MVWFYSKLNADFLKSFDLMAYVHKNKIKTYVFKNIYNLYMHIQFFYI